MMPSLQDYLTSYMKENLFSLVNDWSSNTGIQQINAVCAHIFDVNRSNKMEIKFYDMCTTSGEDWSKAETLFNAIDSTFVKDDLSWTHCVSVGLDNTNGNMGNRNSVKSRVLQKNASCFIAGCSCHLAHIPAKKGGSAYSQTSKCDIEDHMVDLYYYFKGSTRRKGSLTEVLDFSGMVWESLGKYVTTRWLSLEQCADKEVKKELPVLNVLRGNFWFNCFINNFVLNGTYVVEKHYVWRVLFVYPQSRLFGNGGQYTCGYKNQWQLVTFFTGGGRG